MLRWATEKPTVQACYWYRLDKEDRSLLVVAVNPEENHVGPWDDGSECELHILDREWAEPAA
jgi:hypothetical protein